MERPEGALSIGDRVKTPKGPGRVVSRTSASESLSNLGREEKSLEVMRLQAAFGPRWQYVYFVYTVEMDKGPPQRFDSSQVEALDAT